MPRNAPVNFGADDYVDNINFETGTSEPLGDIVHKVELPSPFASEAIKASVGFGKRVTVRLLNRETGRYEKYHGTHWGNGVVLLDRDHEIIAPLLDKIFKRE